MKQLIRIVWLFSALPVLLVQADAAERPNILLITIDDLNDWTGCLQGHPQSMTPNIDRLAEQGILFENAHCQAPICNPSRVSLMTGIRPSTSGVYLNNHGFRRTAALRNAVTMPEYFAAQGYRTLGVGKLFHASRGRDLFQQYGPAEGQGPLPEEKLNCPQDESPTRLWDWGKFPGSDEQTHDVQSAEWGAARLGEASDQPFFLGVGFYRPHVPLYAPARWFDRLPRATVQLPEVFASDRDDLPEFARQLTENSTPPSHDWFVESGEWQHAVQSYLACVTFVDHCVGIVTEALQAGPHADNTWIVLLSDHGFHLGEKQRWAKQSLWERSTRVPLIVVPPRADRSNRALGRRCPQPVELLSIYPTLIELCELPRRDELQGESLVPLLQDVDADWKHVALTTYQQNNHAVRTLRWRYIRYADGSEELYDHDRDPHEWHNLAADPEHAAVMGDLRQRLPAVNVPFGADR